MQKPIVIMVVDPDPLSADRVLEAAQDYLSEVVEYASIELMLAALSENSHADVIVFNLERPFERAFDLLPRLKSKLPQAEVVFVTRFDDETLWVEAIQRGAFDLIPKPLDLSELSRILLLAVQKHRAATTPKRSPANSLRANNTKGYQSTF